MNKRHGNINDLQQIKQLVTTEWSQFKSDLKPQYWEAFIASLTNEQLLTNLLTQSDSIVIENDQNQIIAFCFFSPSGYTTDFYGSRDAFIRMLTVSSQYTGHHLGGTIVNTCIELAKQNGETHIAIETTEMNKSARHLYEKLGFKVVKQLEPKFEKQFFIYELALS